MEFQKRQSGSLLDIFNNSNAEYDEDLIHSIMTGLIPPNDECCHLHLIEGVAKPPSLAETDLARRPHIWKEINSLETKFFNDTAEILAESIQDIYSLLKLPSIAEVRRSIRTGEIPDKQKKFQFPESSQIAYNRIWQDFQQSYIGDKELALDLIVKSQVDYDIEDMPTYKYYLYNAYSVGLSKTLAQIKKALMSFLSGMGLKGAELKKAFEKLLSKQVIPDVNSAYFQSLLKLGMDRVKSKIALANIGKVKQILLEMLGQGKGTMDVARYLHKEIGEGDLWYWLRLVRSEMALAINASFRAQGEAMGLKYEQWRAQSNCCAVCAAFDGQVWEFGTGPEPCILGDCKIMTIEGWEKIKNIKINDLVLTHKGKFKRVTKLFKHKEKNQKMVKIYYKNFPYAKNRSGERFVFLEVTDNHPILINNKWISACEIKSGDKIRLLAARCPVCNKLMPYSRWRDSRGTKANFCSIECGLKVANIWTRKPKEETVKIRKKISDFKKENNPMHNEKYRLKMGESQKERLKNPEIIKQMSESRVRFHNENPEFAKEVVRRWREENPDEYRKAKEMQRKSLSKYYQDRPGLSSKIQRQWQKNNPEKFEEWRKRCSDRAKKQIRENNVLLKGNLEWRKKHPDEFAESINKSYKTLAKKDYISRPQRKLFELIKQFYSDAELNMPIKTNIGVRLGDVVLPNQRIILEYDGQYWHQDKAKELQRDLELQFAGWTVLHFTKDNWTDAPGQIERLMKNHNDKYEFIDIEVSKIEICYRENVTLFNIAVEGDESYLAKGIIVHNCASTHPNCYCIRVGYFKQPPGLPVLAPYNRSPYDNPYSADEADNLRKYLETTIKIPGRSLL